MTLPQHLDGDNAEIGPGIYLLAETGRVKLEYLVIDLVLV